MARKPQPEKPKEPETPEEFQRLRETLRRTGRFATEGEVASALMASGGVQARAAELLGVTRSAICQRLSVSPHLQEVAKEARERVLDISESVVFGALHSKDERVRTQNAQFILERQGKGRGWTRRTEVEPVAPFVVEFSAADAGML